MPREASAPASATFREGSTTEGAGPRTVRSPRATMGTVPAPPRTPAQKLKMLSLAIAYTTHSIP